jgi:F-type H+-transporting ATPase subunit delta
VALAESAKASGTLEAVHGDCETFAAYCSANAGVLSVLENPVLSASKKKDLISKMAKEGGFSTLFVSFLGLLVDKRRTPLTQQVLAEFEAIYCGLTDTQARAPPSRQALCGR